MCRSPSARQSILVIVENVLWHRSSMTGIALQRLRISARILQQGGLAGTAGKAAQPLLDGAFGRRRNVLPCELRENSGQALRFGVFDAQGHWRGPLIAKVPRLPNRNLRLKHLCKGFV